MSKCEKQLEDKLDQANDALMMAREALGADDGPFIDDAIRKLKGDLLDARRERDKTRKALVWTWDNVGTVNFEATAYQMPAFVEMALNAARAATKERGGGDE